MIASIHLTETEYSIIKSILTAERERLLRLLEHANAHGELNPEPERLAPLTSALTKLESFVE